MSQPNCHHQTREEAPCNSLPASLTHRKSLCKPQLPAFLVLLLVRITAPPTVPYPPITHHTPKRHWSWPPTALQTQSNCTSHLPPHYCSSRSIFLLRTSVRVELQHVAKQPLEQQQRSTARVKVVYCFCRFLPSHLKASPYPISFCTLHMKVSRGRTPFRVALAVPLPVVWL